MRPTIRRLATCALLALSFSALAADDPAPINFNVALLLPLSGPLAGPASAVRDGFLSAHRTAGGKGQVRVYDAGSTATSTLDAYHRALKDDAQFIVGPLRKESVTALAEEGRPDEPVLALNYLDNPDDAPRDFYQFGLAPEDEARAAAERAISDGDRRALVIAPDSDWGNRVLAAFEKRLTELGGSIVQTARYAPGTTDYSATIKTLMKLDVSEERHKSLMNIIGGNTEYEPRRRDDIDFIFMPARPADARLLWPQFRYYRAGDLPAYATSLVYDGKSDADLSGVRFCDMPLMLQSPSDDADAKNAGTTPPRSLPRLFALGRDAYRLAGLIKADDLNDDTAYPVLTGSLMMKDRVIARGLTCARFNGDKVEVLRIDQPGSDE